MCHIIAFSIRVLALTNILFVHLTKSYISCHICQLEIKNFTYKFDLKSQTRFPYPNTLSTQRHSWTAVSIPRLYPPSTVLRPKTLYWTDQPEKTP